MQTFEILASSLVALIFLAVTLSIYLSQKIKASEADKKALKDQLQNEARRAEKWERQASKRGNEADRYKASFEKTAEQLGKAKSSREGLQKRAYRAEKAFDHVFDNFEVFGRDEKGHFTKPSRDQVWIEAIENLKKQPSSNS